MQEEHISPTRAGFWEERTGWSRLKQLLFLEPLPGGARWSAAFGSLLLLAFSLQIITGILLATSYSPSVDTAWPSVNYIQEEVPLGDFIRGLHHWGSSAMIILLLFHLIQVFVWGAYKKPRELTWMVGVLLLAFVLGLAFTGYLLPWDQKAYWATKVGLGIASTTPVIGDGVRTLLQGGPELGNLTLTRFFTLHAFILPGLVILLIVVHLYLFRVHGVTPSWWQLEAELKARQQPFWPHQVWKDGVLALAYLVVLGLWVANRPAPLEAQADPSQPYEARPEWYFMFLFQMLRYFEGPWEVVGTFVLPTLFFVILFFWPLLDRNPRRDPRHRPVAMTLLGLGTAALVGMTIFALVTDVRMQEPKLAKAKEPAPSERAGPIQRADVAKVYNGNCAACHGVDGTGKGLRASMPTIPDFTSLAWQQSQHELEITHRILDGNEPLMPAYRDKLTQQQILALAIYVRAFSGMAAGASTPKAPAPPPSATMSPTLIYRSYCQACHDADGRGGIAPKTMNIPNLTDASWWKSHTDAELQHSILEGKKPFMPPMKDKLSPGNARDMVAFLKRFRDGKKVEPIQAVVPPPPVEPKIVPAPKKNGARPTPAVANAETANRMRLATGLFRQNCLICHGVSGSGAEMKASMPAIPDFSQRAWQEQMTDPVLRAAILNGKGKLMPAFAGRVTEDQAKDLVAYIRAFGPARAAPRKGVSPSSDFENQFRKLDEEWQELNKQLKELEKTPGKK